jgi:hypothetical protein
MTIQEIPKPPFPKQIQPMPGLTAKMNPVPDHGEQSYKGTGRLKDKKAIITGGTAASDARLRSPMPARVPTCSLLISKSTRTPRRQSAR